MERVWTRRQAYGGFATGAVIDFPRPRPIKGHSLTDAHPTLPPQTSQTLHSAETERYHTQEVDSFEHNNNTDTEK